MWRFTRNNGITEGFHTVMELINRQAFGFRNARKLRNARQRAMWLTEEGFRSWPRTWRGASATRRRASK